MSRKDLHKDCEVRMTWCMSVTVFHITSRSDALVLTQNSPGSPLPPHPPGWQIGFAPNADLDLKKPHESTVTVLFSPGYALIDVKNGESVTTANLIWFHVSTRLQTFNISVVLTEFNPFHLQLNQIFRSVFTWNSNSCFLKLAKSASTLLLYGLLLSFAGPLDIVLDHLCWLVARLRKL